MPEYSDLISRLSEDARRILENPALLATREGCQRFLMALADGRGCTQNIFDDMAGDILRDAVIDFMEKEYGLDAPMLHALYDDEYSEAVVLYKGYLVSVLPSSDEHAEYLCNCFTIDADAGRLVGVDDPVWTKTLYPAEAIAKCVEEGPYPVLDLDALTFLSSQTVDCDLDLSILAEEVGKDADELFRLARLTAARAIGEETSVADLERVLGKERMGELLDDAADALYFDRGDGGRRICEYYWDYRDASPFDESVMRDWTREIARRKGYAHPYLSIPVIEENMSLGFSGSAADLLWATLQDRLYERSWGEWMVYWESERMDSLKSEFASRASEAISEILGDDIAFDVDYCDFNDAYCDDIAFDYGLDRWLSETVNLDIVLAKGEEYNTEFSSCRDLRYALQDGDPAELGDSIESSALIWLASTQGIEPAVLLGDEEALPEAAKPFRELLMDSYYGNELTLCVSMPLGSYLDLVAAYATGEDLVVDGKPSWCLFDSWNGGGSDFYELTDGALTIPAELVADIAIDGGWTRHDSLRERIGLLSDGWSIHHSYGMADDPWSCGSIVPEHVYEQHRQLLGSRRQSGISYS